MNVGNGTDDYILVMFWILGGLWHPDLPRIKGQVAVIIEHPFNYVILYY